MLTPLLSTFSTVQEIAAEHHRHRSLASGDGVYQNQLSPRSEKHAGERFEMSPVTQYPRYDWDRVYEERDRDPRDSHGPGYGRGRQRKDSAGLSDPPSPTRRDSHNMKRVSLYRETAPATDLSYPFRPEPYKTDPYTTPTSGRSPSSTKTPPRYFP